MNDGLDALPHAAPPHAAPSRASPPDAARSHAAAPSHAARSHATPAALIADEPNEIVAATLQLHRSDLKWRRASDAALTAFGQMESMDPAADDMAALLRAACAGGRVSHALRMTAAHERISARHGTADCVSGGSTPRCSAPTSTSRSSSASRLVPSALN